MHTADALIQSALVHHRDGRLAEAEAMYRKLLDENARHPHALSMLGMILMDHSGTAEAESLFRRHLEVEPGSPTTLHNMGRLLQARGNDREAVVLFRQAAESRPDFKQTFADLAASLHRLGYWDEALLAVKQALSLDPGFSAAHEIRGLVLFDCHRFAEAVEAFLAALMYTGIDAAGKRASVQLHIAKAAIGAGDLAAAEQACRAILETDADNADAIDKLAEVMYRLRRDDEARSLLNRLARAQGLRSKRPAGKPEATILVLAGVGAGHVPTRYLLDPERFATMTMTLVSPDEPDAPLGGIAGEALAEADIVFNALGEAEKTGGQIPAVAALLARLGKPVLNPPDYVVRTGRDRAQALYGDIPGLRVPGVHCMSRDDLARLATIAEPFLIRPGGSHGGKDLALVETPPDLARYLAKTPGDRFVLTEFHDFKGSGGHYRKYRFIFVDREPFPYHLAIGDSWLVHYWRARMGCESWKKREEEDFLADWRQSVGPTAVAAIEQVAQRLDLDYGGMDCGVLAGGDVLFFEANACMLVHLDDAEAEFPYKHRSVPRIRDRVTRMVRERIETRNNRRTNQS
jgi:Flp pilus assembly protein TadD